MSSATVLAAIVMALAIWGAHLVRQRLETPWRDFLVSAGPLVGMIGAKFVHRYYGGSFEDEAVSWLIGICLWVLILIVPDVLRRRRVTW